MSSTKLKSCPFCKCKKIERESVRGCLYLRCSQCSSTGGHQFSHQDNYTWEAAEKKWNTRTKIEIVKEVPEVIPSENIPPPIEK